MHCLEPGLLLLRGPDWLPLPTQVSTMILIIRGEVQVILMTCLVYVGQFVGSVISFPLTALLCVYGFDGGWPSVFYIFGR